MIPVQYTLHPPCQEGERLKAQARRVMIILDRMMQLGRFDQHLIRFVPYDGALIVARNVFGTRTVDIYTQLPLREPKEELPSICLCNCNFSIGWVMDVQEDNINGATLYTVMACNVDGKAYVPHNNILASDWTIYEVGQRVALIPYNAMSYLCCTDPTGSGGPRGCSPVVSTEVVSSAAWRTTYRISPLCARTTPIKIDPALWNPYG